ncbi:MAG: dihydrolipoyl dehydrogenase [Deltaproteobacteria bacterium]|nr:dihydrolipoyl dehydrogenase [Deltaproteobacteria bacterium]MBW2050755.1 dihydrolipoyl dehydrogenase [Deltaproteobacteria bacterium]MBW2140466.1 dihydrolipoyl dehydrogenase [Deltaproteobacteria bacterium]MBW2321985.1 dihydrolipoyl dehydrogenase [Deltaproteobacteria bacterium]
MYDVVVIGGGPGGYAAGIRAAQLGGQVALVESFEMGGVCVNRGCIPSKIWLRAVYLNEMIKNAGEFGIKAKVDGFDLSTIVERKNGIAGDIRMGMGGLLANNGIEVIEGRGALKSPHEVDVEGKTLEAKKIIIATGSSVAMPEIEGLDKAAMTTDQVFEMKKVPGSVLVDGAEAMAVEMAALFNAFGSKVYLVTGSARILSKEDGDTSQRVAQVLREKGVEILTRAELQSVKKAKKGFEISLAGSKDQNIAVDKVLVSSRKPNTKDLGLDQAGVKLDDGGFIEVNENLQTSAEGIYAIGDVIGGWMLSHAATAMGITASENAMGTPAVFPFNLVPRGIFTIPEVGAVGLSEEEAEDKGHEVETGDFPLSINGLAMSYGELDGAVKIVSDAEYGDILGVHIVGGRATEMIWGAVLAMQLECTAEELARSIPVHPTYSESIAMAAQDALGWALYLPKS